MRASPGIVAYKLHTAEHAIGGALEVALRPLEVTPPQVTVLLHVDRLPGLTGAALARRAAVTPQSMHRIVVGLERRGLLARGSAAADRKSLPLSLTAAGARVLAMAEEVVNRELAAMRRSFSARELEVLAGLLERVEQVFSGRRSAR